MVNGRGGRWEELGVKLMEGSKRKINGGSCESEEGR